MPAPMVLRLPRRFLVVLVPGFAMRKLIFGPLPLDSFFAPRGGLNLAVLAYLGSVPVFWPGLELAFVVNIALCELFA